MDNKKNLTQVIESEEEIKKSRFIGICAPIKSIDDFDAFLLQKGDTAATHNCWAYRIGQTYRFNDDGEPSGTAGKPILAAIDGADFDGVAALVIRHYGGIKLGTGGLARAYGGVIARMLQSAPHERHVPQDQLRIDVDFALEQSLHQQLKTHQGQIKSVDYHNRGIKAVVELPRSHTGPFIETLKNLSKGLASIQRL